jgi:hypothetical protein
MRQQLIEALLYPRKMVEELIEEGNYTHKNLFEAIAVGITAWKISRSSI